MNDTKFLLEPTKQLMKTILNLSSHGLNPTIPCGSICKHFSEKNLD